MLYEKCNNCQYAHSQFECKRHIFIVENRTIQQENNGKEEKLGQAIKWVYGKKIDNCTNHSEQELSLADAVAMDKKGVHSADIQFLTQVKDLMSKSAADQKKIATSYATDLKKAIDALMEPTLALIQDVRTKANLTLLEKLDKLGNFIRK